MFSGCNSQTIPLLENKVIACFVVTEILLHHFHHQNPGQSCQLVRFQGSWKKSIHSNVTWWKSFRLCVVRNRLLPWFWTWLQISALAYLSGGSLFSLSNSLVVFLEHNQDHDMYISSFIQVFDIFPDYPKVCAAFYQPEVLLVSSLCKLIQAYLNL